MKKKEAMKILKDFHDKSALFSVRTALDTIIPELKESEDERIRKSIIEYFESCNIKHLDWIAWLEKQGKKISDKIVEKARTEKQRVLLTETNGSANIDWDCRSLDDVKILLEYGLDYIKKLEKQGEQKPFDYENTNIQQKDFASIDPYFGKPIDKVEPKFKVGDKIIEKDFDECGCGTIIDIKDGKYIFDDGSFVNIEEQNLWQLVEQKLADKVEPKFHLGDWITHNIVNFVFKVINVGSNRYDVVNRENYKKTISFDNENNYHLWTIQDAKDGDVLTWDGTTCVVLFKNIKNNKCFISYCFTNDISFEIGTSHYIEGCHPATKEQRDALMKAMTDAGYTFDFEKKELKKVDIYC